MLSEFEDFKINKEEKVLQHSEVSVERCHHFPRRVLWFYVGYIMET